MKILSGIKTLGSWADSKPTAVSDSSEASAGWYWQFNKKQGFKHDGINITPEWPPFYNPNVISDWLNTNDPCEHELGFPWRIPTKAEWENLITGGGWTNWDGPWNSGLKLHPEGFISTQYSVPFLSARGELGFYWSGSQYNDIRGYRLYFNDNNCFIYIESGKQGGSPIRCVRD